MTGTPTLDVARLSARYRIPADAADERQRLDAVLGLVLGETLAPAVDGVVAPAPDELVCIRSVDAPVRLALGRHGDRALAAAWAGAIGAAVAACLHAGGPDVVRYGSRRHALLDMALCVAAGDRSREWAWRSLALWAASHDMPERALVAALVDEPAAVAPVLAHVARSGRLGGLVARLTPAAWLALAAAALRASGASDDLARRALAATDAPVVVPSAVARALRSSHIAAALSASGAPVGAVAALALVEAEPGGVAALGEQLAHALPRRPADLDRGGPSERGRAVDGDGVPTEHQRADGHRPSDGDLTETGAPAETAAPAQTGEPAPLVPRARATSRFGGLVFAVHALVALDAAAWLGARLPDVELPRSLHALALALAADARPGDPCALAFCGMLPDDEPPRPLPEDGAGTIAELAGAVREWLAGRLDLAPAELDLDALLERSAEIVADPGWIEFHLRSDEIDTAVRRAGLDLDPDHLPFIGCVVRIVYA